MSVVAAAESAFIISVELSRKLLFWTTHMPGTNFSSFRTTPKVKTFNDK